MLSMWSTFALGNSGTIRGINRGAVDRADGPQAGGTYSQYRLSNVTREQIDEAQKITKIVCVQNFYNVAHRNDDALIDNLATQGIAYVPFFPLGGFTPLQSSELDVAAASLQVTPMQLALAWLLQRSPNILLIPGTSSRKHLRENLQATTLQIPSEVLANLEAIPNQTVELPRH
jgi:aryl-alcohol dehydrogenase-like predicted oxidoreductase